MKRVELSSSLMLVSLIGLEMATEHNQSEADYIDRCRGEDDVHHGVGDKAAFLEHVRPQHAGQSVQHQEGKDAYQVKDNCPARPFLQPAPRLGVFNRSMLLQQLLGSPRDYRVGIIVRERGNQLFGNEFETAVLGLGDGRTGRAKEKATYGQGKVISAMPAPHIALRGHGIRQGALGGGIHDVGKPGILR